MSMKLELLPFEHGDNIAVLKINWLEVLIAQEEPGYRDSYVLGFAADELNAITDYWASADDMRLLRLWKPQMNTLHERQDFDELLESALRYAHLGWSDARFFCNEMGIHVEDSHV